MTPEVEQRLKDRIAELQLKYNIVLSPQDIKKVSIELAKQDPVTWGMTYRMLRGEPYRFSLPESLRTDEHLWVKHRPFLKQMLADQAQNKCYEKSRQCGASESSVTEVLWFLDTHPSTKAMYVFPTFQQMQDFANSRIKACMQETKYLQALQGEIDNVGLKQIGKNSFLFMRSGQTSRLGEGVDADALFVDEKDRMSDKIEAAFEQSLSSSRYKLLREFSTPTLPGVGVDKSFQASCQYYWFVKCASGHWQTLDMDNIQQNNELDITAEIVPPGTYSLKCTHQTNGVPCVSQINRWDGTWIPKYDDHRRKTHTGYHINQLSCVWLPIDKIMQQKLKYRFADIFSNYVLGMPYASNEGLITQDQLMSALDQTRNFPNMRKPEYSAIVVGIDWGYINWCIVMGRRLDGRWEICGFHYCKDDSNPYNVARTMADYIRPFNPQVIVADLGYGRDRCMELLNIFPDKVFACSYVADKSKQFQPLWNEGQFRVSVDRTAHLRNMLQGIKTRRILFPGQPDTYQLIWKHLLNLALIHVEEEDPDNPDPVIIERIGHKGDDHFAHAMAYAALAAERLTQGGTLSWEFLRV
jgi:hypothetical protein